MVNLDDLYRGLISVISDEVGSQLTTIDGEFGDIPAIFRARQMQYKTYPYITIDVLSVKHDGGWLRSLGANAEGKTEHVFEYQYLFLITCFGNDSASILTELKQKLNFERVRLQITANSNNQAVYQYAGTIVQSPQFIETSFEPQSSLEVVINVTDTIVDEDSTIIESTTIEGTLKSPEDATPITTTIIVP